MKIELVPELKDGAKINAWEVYDNHIMPFQDLRDHHPLEECWCIPTEDEGVWIHHSLDRREIYEEGKELS